MNEQQLQRQAERFAALQLATKHGHTLVVQAAMVVAKAKNEGGGS